MDSQGPDLQFIPASDPPSPAPSASFLALLDDITAYTPDTQGAIGTNHIVTMLSSQVRVQNRISGAVSTVSLNTFWGAVGNSNVYDPRVLYDSFAHRWIATAIANPGANNSSVLIAVSQTSDPASNWYRHSIQVDAAASIFPDSPNVGLTKDWIIVQANTFNETNFFFFSSEIRVFTKANLYAGGAALFRYFKDTNAVSEVNAAVPAVNYDNAYATNFLISNWDGGNANDGETFGYLRVYSISGPVGVEVFQDYGTNGLYVDGGAFGNPPWNDYSPLDENFAPQLGTANKIYIGDARIQNVVYRNASLWCAQHVFLPAGTPTRCSVQWWAFTTGGSVLQRGRRDDGSGTQLFAYPSIAVNTDEDVLIGYSRFGANQFPSANYSFHGYEDGPGTLRLDTVLKAGEASFFVDDNGFNHWGNWSATVVDPLNDTDLWTIQEYAASHAGTTNRWGTWWGRVSPPTSLSLFATAAPGSVTAGANVTYSVRVTNNFATRATGLRVSSTLPSGAQFVSAASSQGSCGFNNGVVTCAFGDVAGNVTVTASIVAQLNQNGTATNTITALANGPDEDNPADNTVKVLTAVSAAADLALSLSGSSDPVTVSNVLTYVVTVTNRGPSAANQVLLTNVLPPGVTFISANAGAGQGTCSGSSTVVCSLGTMTSAASVNVTIVVRPIIPGQLTNRASVGATTPDPNMSNNSNSLVTTANAAPTLQAISNRTINEDTVLGPITFTVGDLETPAGSLEVVAFSSNQALVPNGNISLEGIGSSRTITVTPAPNVSGVVNITRIVTDGGGATATHTFTNTIIAVNDPPTLTDIPQQSVDEDRVLGPIAFTVGDIETAAGTLTVSGASSNPILIPNANIKFSEAGSANRMVTITPATNQSGTATITVRVSDGTVTTEDTFVVTVNEINDRPTITDVTDRTVNEDVSTGTLTFTIGDVETLPAQLLLDRASSNPTLVPTNNITFGGSGANRNVTITPASNEFGSATITLFVNDLNGGSTNDTFVLTVNLVNDAPTLDGIPDLTIIEDAPIPSVTLSNITSGASNEIQTNSVVATSDNPGLIPNPISIAYNHPDVMGTLSFSPTPNSSGMALITVTVDDGGATNNILVRRFNVNILATNDAPTISDIPDRTTSEDTPTGSIPFSVGDVDSSILSLSFRGASSNPSLVPEGGILFGGEGANPTVNITPAANQSGSAIITVFVSDGFATNSDSFLLTVEEVNDLPSISTLADATIKEDTVTNLSFTISDLETLPDDLSLSAISSNPNLIPAVSFGGQGNNRTLNIVPVENQSGNATITITVRDGNNGSNSTSVTVFVLSVDDPPTLSPIDDLTINEDDPQRTVVLSGITSGAANESQSLMLTATTANPSLVQNLQVSYNSPNDSGTLTFTPAPNLNGTATISVAVTDGAATNTRSFVVTVLDINDPPAISLIDDLDIDEDTTATISFWANDLETTADQLSFVGTSSNQELLEDVSISFGGSGTNRTIILTPLLDQSGSATFITITVTDGGNQVGSTSFELTVLPVNDLPAISGLFDRAIKENAGPTNIVFTVSDPELLPSQLNVTAFSSNPLLIPNANLALSGSSSTRTLTLTPLPNQVGSATISIVAKEGVGANPGSTTNTFRLTVATLDEPPFISNIADASVGEDVPLTVPFTVNDLETAPSLLMLTASSSNPALLPVSAISFGGADSSRTVTLVPTANQTGSVTVIITVTDAKGSGASDLFVLTVNPVNDPPTLSGLPDLIINEDAPTGPLSLTTGDVDTASGGLSLTASSSNSGLVPSSNVIPGGSGANRTITITPVANQSGSTVITLNLSDGSGSTNITFTLTVVPVNDPPVISDIPDQATNEDTPTGAIPFTIGDMETVAGNLTVAATSSDTNVIPATAFAFGGSDANRTVTVTPAPNQSGTSTVRIIVSDGTNQVSDSFVLTINQANDGPSITDIQDRQTNEDTPVTVPFTIGDPETAGLSLVLSGSSANTGLVANTNILFGGSGTNRTVTITPSPNLSGTTLITLRITDGIATTLDTFLLTVNEINDPPTLDLISNTNVVAAGGNPSYTINLTGITSGPANESSQGLAVTATAVPPMANVIIPNYAGGTTGSLTVAPGNNTTGSWLITVIVSDGQSSSVRTFTFTSRATGNVRPTISTITPQAINEDTSTANIPFTVRDAETAAASLSLVAVSTDQTLLPNANIAFGGSGTNRTVMLRPAPNRSGTTAVRMTVTDGANGSSNMTFTLTVNPLNDAPTISLISDQTVTEDAPTAPITFNVSDVDTSAANFAVTVSSGNQMLVPDGNIVIGGSGTDRALVITPAPNQSGSATITVNVSDGSASANTQFTLNVTPANDPPTITGIPNQTTTEDTPKAGIPFTIGDVETAAATLTLSATSSNTNLISNTAFAFEGSGANRTLTATPMANQSGTAMITLNVGDGTNQVTTAFDLTVSPVNDPPTLDLIADRLINQSTSTQVVNLTGIGSGAPNESQTLIVAASSSNPLVIPHPIVNYNSPASTGALSLTPVPNSSGSSTINVTVNDGQTQSNLVTRTFTVTVNSAPVLSSVANQAIDEDTPTSAIAFTLSDPDNVIATLSLTAHSSNTNLVPDANIVLEGTGINRTATIAPATNQFGFTTITLTAGDPHGNVTTSSFLLTVVSVNDAPPIEPVLRIDRSGENVVISWTTNGSSNWTLQSSTQMDGANSWRAVGTTLVVVNGRYTVTQAANAATRLYRLCAGCPNNPELTIRRSGTSVLLAWPASAGSFVLESNEDVTMEGGWIVESETAVEANGEFTVTLDAANSRRFYRLRKQ